MSLLQVVVSAYLESMRVTFRWSSFVAVLALTPVAAPVGAQAGGGAPESIPPVSLPGVPAMPDVRGPLDLTVVSPKWRDLVDAPDTNFIFGSTGNGTAQLTVNGYSARVWPNGAWFAWIPFPQDSLMEFHLVARTESDTAELTYVAQRAARFVPPTDALWIDTTSITPRRKVWWPAGEELPIALRAAPGATVRIILPDGSEVPMFVDSAPAGVPWGIRAFGRDPAKLRRAVDGTRYVGVLQARAIGPPAGPVVDMAMPRVELIPCPQAHGIRCQESPEAGPAVIEAVRGSDTTRATWPIQVMPLDGPAPVVELDDDPAGEGDTDGITIGRAAPGATFHWFLPRGTRASVSGRINGALRLQLSSSATAWVPADEARALPAGMPMPRARVGFLTLTPSDDRVTVRIPVGRRVPFRIDEGGTAVRLRLYGAYGNPNWIRYGGTDDLVDRVDWSQDRTDEVVLSFELSEPVWGYRTRWEGNDLLLEIRRPPVIDPERPLRDRYIMIDPGHPPAGAKGPTGLREAEANLAVSLRIRTLLEQAGARVVMTRAADSAVGLWPRIHQADSLDVELLVSVHNNALPDGVNPFLAHGSSVYYFHPQSVHLAREIQRAFVRQLRLRNLGVSRGNLALTRPTWMPAVLTEGLFIMMPEQEAALRTEEGQQLYALAVVEGIEAFLEGRGRAQR